MSGSKLDYFHAAVYNGHPTGNYKLPTAPSEPLGSHQQQTVTQAEQKPVKGIGED